MQFIAKEALELWEFVSSNLLQMQIFNNDNDVVRVSSGL